MARFILLYRGPATPMENITAAESEQIATEEPQPARNEGFDVPDDVLEVPSFLRDN